MKENNDGSILKAEYLLLMILILMMLPFVILHFFNNPNSEDFVYGEQANRIGFVDSFLVLYKFWGGRYFTYIFLNITPLSIIGYRVTTLLLMAAFLYSLFLLVSEIAEKSLVFREKFLISLSIFSLYLYSMATVAEGFYWYGSVVGYHICVILMMLFAVLYIRLENLNNSRGKIILTFILCLILMAIAGSVELGAILILFLLIFLIIKNIVIEKKMKWTLILFSLITIVFAYIAYSSPGNLSRTVRYLESHNIIFSVSSTLAFLAQNIFSWTFTTPLLPVTLLLIPIFIKLSKSGINPGIISAKPVYSLTGSFGLLFLSVFTIYWSMGFHPYERIANFIYFIFLTGWFYNAAVLTSYFSKKHEISIQKIYRYGYAVSFIIIALLLFDKNNISTAYDDLISGKASEYNDEVRKRFDFISQSGLDSVQVDSIKTIPGSFHIYDNVANPNHFLNGGYELHFNKKSVTLKK